VKSRYRGPKRHRNDRYDNRRENSSHSIDRRRYRRYWDDADSRSASSYDRYHRLSSGSRTGSTGGQASATHSVSNSELKDSISKLTGVVDALSIKMTLPTLKP